MKVSIQNASFEYRSLVVASASVKRIKRYYAKRGWQLRGEQSQRDGKTALNFSRESVGNIEVQP